MAHPRSRKELQDKFYKGIVQKKKPMQAYVDPSLKQKEKKSSMRGIDQMASSQTMFKKEHP